MIITWVGAVWWVVTGGIKYRQVEIQGTIDELKERGRTQKVTVDGGPMIDDYGTPVLAIRSGNELGAGKEAGDSGSKEPLGPVERSERSSESTRSEDERATTNKDQKTGNEKATLRKDRISTSSPSNDPQDTTSCDARPILPSLEAGLKQFRTVLVSNIPPAMRDENTLRTYFETALSAPEPATAMEPFTQDPVAFMKRHFKRNSNMLRMPKSHLPVYRPKKEIGKTLPDVQEVTEGNMDSSAGPVEEIVLVRKVQDIASLRKRLEATRKRLELVSIDANLAAVEHDADTGCH